MTGLPLSSKAFNEFVQERNPAIKHLDASEIFFDSIPSFSTLENLEELRLSSVEIFPRDVFRSLKKLTTIYSMNYKLCCPQLLPSHMSPNNCHAPEDEISSCKSLLRSGLYRIFVWFFSAIALIGNFASFILR